MLKTAESNVKRWPAATSDRPAIVPSLLAADPLALGDAVDHAACADALLIDVMDGHFVPNLAFTPAQTRAIHERTNVPLDVHLMMTEPHHFVAAFAEAGAFGITLHAEAIKDLPTALESLHRLGVAPGISVRAETDVNEVLARLGAKAELLSMLLIMSVAPGFGGQSFNLRALDNVARAKAVKQKRQLDFRIEVDGGINEDTASHALKAGAESLVIGTALFSQTNVPQAISSWRSRFVK